MNNGLTHVLRIFFLQLTGDISHLRLGLLKEGFSRPQSEPDVDELVKKGAEGLAKKTGASLQDISVPMHLDGKFCFPSFCKTNTGSNYDFTVLSFVTAE